MLISPTSSVPVHDVLTASVVVQSCIALVEKVKGPRGTS
jgi:hypothetical protein